MNVGMKHLKLSDKCVLVDWDVSLLYNLESIEIGNECFESVQTFQIDGLNRLQTIKIESNQIIYSEKSDYENNWSKSFYILNCESLIVMVVNQRFSCKYYLSCQLEKCKNLNVLTILLINS